MPVCLFWMLTHPQKRMAGAEQTGALETSINILTCDSLRIANDSYNVSIPCWGVPLEWRAFLASELSSGCGIVVSYLGHQCCQHEHFYQQQKGKEIFMDRFWEELLSGVFALVWTWSFSNAWAAASSGRTHRDIQINTHFGYASRLSHSCSKDIKVRKYTSAQDWQ